MIVVEDFNASLVLQAVHKERATALYGVPTMFIAELNSPEFDQYDLPAFVRASWREAPVLPRPCVKSWIACT